MANLFPNETYIHIFSGNVISNFTVKHMVMLEPRIKFNACHTVTV